MKDFIEGFKRGMHTAWELLKLLLIVLAIVGFASCAYYLDHLRFTL